MGKRVAQISFDFYRIISSDTLRASGASIIRYCTRNNIGNVIQYHSIHIISIIQCRFDITALGQAAHTRTVSYREIAEKALVGKVS